MNLCPDISSIAPMERYALHFLACRAVASWSTPTEWLTLKAAISITTPLLMCACIFEPFPELSSIAPLELDLALAACRAVVSMSAPAEWLTLKPAIFMTTKRAREMCARFLPLPRHFLHRPIELTLELTDCCARARDFGVADVSVCILNRLRHFLHRPAGTLRNQLLCLAGRRTLHLGHGNPDQHQRVLEPGIWGALTFCPCLDISSIAPMERYALHFLARRAVASLSIPAEWLTLKAVISMTTRLLTCACLLPLP